MKRIMTVGTVIVIEDAIVVAHEVAAVVTVAVHGAVLVIATVGATDPAIVLGLAAAVSSTSTGMCPLPDSNI